MQGEREGRGKGMEGGEQLTELQKKHKTVIFLTMLLTITVVKEFVRNQRHVQRSKNTTITNGKLHQDKQNYER